MIRRQPGVALDRLIEALEAEILTTPEPEVRDVFLEAEPQAHLKAVRALVARAVDEAEQTATLPPSIQGGPALHRP